MGDLASFLPRHFAAPPPELAGSTPSLSSMEQPSSSLASSSSCSHSHSHPHSHLFRRGSLSGFSSTASDSSSSDSPHAGGLSSSSASPSPPAKGRLFFPSSLGNNQQPLTALLPSAPDLTRQHTQPPPTHVSSLPLSVQPGGGGGKVLWINTERPVARAASRSTLGGASLPNVPSFTPPSSPAGSSSPMTATDLPAVHAMRISVSPAVDNPSPASSPLSASFTASPSIPQPRSPTPHLRHVPLVTPPSSPATAHSEALAGLEDSARSATDDTSSANAAFVQSPPAACLSLGDSLALSFCPEASLPELLASISMVIHVQLVKDEQASDEAKSRLPAFRELPSLSSSTVTSTSVCPSVRSIYQFLLHVFQRGRFQSELALLSLVYVHRAMASSRVALTPTNFRPLLIASLCVANKMWDDTPLINADFRILYPQLLGCSSAHSLSKQQYLAVFNKLETQLCSAIDWNLAVSTDTFHLYLHELQAIWTEYEHGLHTQQLSATTSTGTASMQQQAHKTGQEATKGAGKLNVHSHRHHPYAVRKRSKERALLPDTDRTDSKCDSDGELNHWMQAAHHSSPAYYSAGVHHMPLQQQAVL